MKTIQFCISIVAALTLLSGCNDDFLKKEEWKPALSLKMRADPPLYLTSKQELAFTIPGAGNSAFSLVQFPGWMIPEDVKGNASNDTLTLTYRQDTSIFRTVSPFSFRFKVDGIGQVEVLVNFAEKLVTILELQPEKLDFGLEEVSQVLKIFNKGNLEMNLRIDSFPQWVRFNNTSELNLWIGSELHLDVFCERVGMASGKHTGEIVLKYNNDRLTIPVSIEVEDKVNKDLFAIEGKVKGAAFNKSTGIMYIATQAPNQVVIYNTSDDSKRVIPLTNAPKCIKLSEDGKLAFVGHSGLLSVIDTDSERVSSRIDTDFSTFDLVYGENDWCYISIEQNYSYIMYAINIKTRQIASINSYRMNFGSYTNLIKIKGKPVLLGSRTNVSPSGVLLADISNPTEITEGYWHDSHGRLWLSEDQAYIYGSTGTVFKTPTINTGEIHELYRLDTGYSYWTDNIAWIESSAAAKSIWAIQRNPRLNNERVVRRYETTDYTLRETFYPAKSPGIIDGNNDFYPTAAHYIFADKAGNNLFMIKNIIDLNSYKELNAWSVQKINIDKQ